MYKFWTKGLSEEDAKQMKQDLIAAKPAFKRLREHYQEGLITVEKSMRNKLSYRNSAWPYQQADSLGEQRAIKRLIDIVDNLYNET